MSILCLHRVTQVTIPVAHKDKSTKCSRWGFEMWKRIFEIAVRKTCFYMPCVPPKLDASPRVQRLPTFLFHTVSVLLTAPFLKATIAYVTLLILLLCNYYIIVYFLLPVQLLFGSRSMTLLMLWNCHLLSKCLQHGSFWAQLQLIVTVARYYFPQNTDWLWWYAYTFIIYTIYIYTRWHSCFGVACFNLRFGQDVEFVTLDVSNWTANSGNDDLDWCLDKP